MKRVTILNITFDSVNLLRKNMILFVPNAIILMIHSFVILFLLNILGLINRIQVLEETISRGEMVAYMRSNLIVFMLFFILYFLIILFTDSFFIAMKFGMIKDVIKEKTTSLKKGFIYGRRHFKRVMGIHALSLLMLYVPLGIIGFGVHFFITYLSLGNEVLLGLFFMIGALYLIFVSYRLMFIYPVMVFHEKDTLSSFREDFHYVKTHLGHTLISWMIVIGVSAGAYSIQSVPKINLILGILMIVAVIFIEVAVSTWEHVFVFESYIYS